MTTRDILLVSLMLPFHVGTLGQSLAAKPTGPEAVGAQSHPVIVSALSHLKSCVLAPDLNWKRVRVLASSDSLHQRLSTFRLDLMRETALLGGGGVMGISGLVIVHNVQPLTIDEINALDPSDISSFDRSSISTFRDTPAGDALLYGSFLMPLTLLVHEDSRMDWKTLGVMWAEVMLIQSGLNTMAKGLTQRTRPYVYDPSTPLSEKMNRNARLSFFSGHTSTTAATSFFVARVFSEYLSNTVPKVLIWTGAAIYPALTGFLRRNSGHHFQTDVIVGYSVGAMIGYFIPELHKGVSIDKVSFHQSSSNNDVGVGIVYHF